MGFLNQEISHRMLHPVVHTDSLSVDYFDTETANMKNTEMYVEGFKAKLEKDTSYRGLWQSVSD